ncbi:MAG: nuclear transport factor 2 family protein [Ferruginibacter sp.]
MKKIILSVLVISTALATHAQSAEDSVKAVINNLFTAMKTSNAVLLKSVFADSAVLQTIETRGGTKVKTDAVAGFVESISKLPAGAADEQITFDVVKIDGALASVWTPYKFYFNGKFSHCGVNSFQLVRFNGEWKIQYLIDTRRRTNCD